MLLRIGGLVANFIGSASCLIVFHFAMRLWRLGERRAFFLSGGALFISLGLFLDGLVFLLFFPMRILFLSASLLILTGYIFMVGSYTVQSFRNPWTPLLVSLPLMLFGTVELLGTLLAFYLLILVAYNTGKMGGRTGPLTVLTYFLLFTFQLLIVWGLLHVVSRFFLWGIALRGLSFLPLLCVALESQLG